MTIEIGAGVTTGNFSTIDWSNGPYFLQTETDPLGGTSYTINGVSQFLSVPYSLYSQNAANGFSGDYNDLTNKPVTDGSETKIQAGTNVTVTGSGTIPNPYVINSIDTSPPTTTVVLTNSQTWTVPPATSNIKVELWGAAGGGGGAGAYSYSYSLSLNLGGSGGSGGYAMELIPVTPNQTFTVVLSSGGIAGTNATNFSGYWTGDTDGGNGGDCWFGDMKAAGGTGGKKGSYTTVTTNGAAGTANTGPVTAYSSIPQNNVLDMWQGIIRSYLGERTLTSRPGKGGCVTYPSFAMPTSGEAGCAVITFW
jgi:hypothetical protein